MQNLPQGRELKKLGDIGKIVTGTTPSKKEEKYWGGNVPFVKPPELGSPDLVYETSDTLTDDGKQKAKPIPKNSLMVCCIGSIGKVGIAGTEVCTNQQINSIIPNEDIVYPKFVYYYSYIIESKLKFFASQAVVSIINKTIFSDIQIPIPPLETQKKIVEKLDEKFEDIDKSIQLLEKNIQNIDELNKSTLNKVFEEGEGEFRKIGDKSIFTVTMGQSPLSNTYNQNGEGLPFFQGKKEFGEVYPIVDKYCSNPVKIAEKGDILLSVRAPVGPTNIADRKSCIGRGLASIRTDEKKCNMDYLLYFFKKFEKNISSLGKGSTFNAITKKDLENLSIPLPSLEKQKEIVEYLDKIFETNQHLKQQYQQKLNNLQELKKSILNSAFEGKLI